MYLKELFLFILLFLQIPILMSRSKQLKIVGGELVDDIIKYPFMASIQNKYNFGHTYCGGSIIHRSWILTVAHCICYLRTTIVVYPSELLVLVGIVSFEEIKEHHKHYIKSLIKHEKYDTYTKENDIGLIYLIYPLELNIIRPVNLPLPEFFTEKNPDEIYKNCIGLGWGTIEEGSEVGEKQLRFVGLPLISTSECRRLLDEKVTENHVCTMYIPGKQDTCKGDSGGPLLCNNIQIGITSWGSGCGKPNTPSVYTRVDKYIDWIELQIKSSSFNITNNIISILYIIYIINSLDIFE